MKKILPRDSMEFNGEYTHYIFSSFSVFVQYFCSIHVVFVQYLSQIRGLSRNGIVLECKKRTSQFS